MTEIGLPDDPPILVPVLRHVKRSLIVGLHPCLESLYSELSIPPFREIPPKAITSQEVGDLLAIFPVHVTRVRSRLRCTGNVRLFRLAIRYLKDESNIPCIEEASFPEAALVRRALTELIYGPACLGTHFSDVRILAEVARRAIAAGRLHMADRPIEVQLSSLYGVDRRRFKEEPRPGDQTSHVPDGLAIDAEDLDTTLGIKRESC